MAEDNKDEWGGDQPASSQGGAQGAPGAERDSAERQPGQGDTSAETFHGDFIMPGYKPVEPAADKRSGDTGATTNAPADANTGADAIASVGSEADTNATKDINTTPTETISKDDAGYGPYRPAPEFGAYGPAPTASNPNGAADGNVADGNVVDGTSGMPWNGIFNGLGSNDGNAYGAPTQGQPNQGNGSEYGDPNMPGGQQGGFGAPPSYGPGDMGGNGNQNGRNGGSWASAHSNIITAIVAAVVAAALCLGISFAAISRGWISIPSSGTMSGISSNKSGPGTATVNGGQAPDWASVSKQVSGSVVSIQAQVSQGIAKGSGAVLDNKGHIVTNNHVISGGKNIQVTLSNGQIFTASVVGTDTTTDLAVIKIDNAPSDLKPVTFADSDKLAVGENVMAVGNPLGYDDTATTGIVSALDRPVSVMDDNNSEIVTNAVQIDAAINPGNSGGPTFNAAGQVIGINSSIASASSSQSQSGSIGIGFAIPSDLVKRIADEIVSKGSVKHAMLGVTIKNATATSDGITRGGAQITKSSSGGSAVVKGSPADKAGLKADDTVVAFNGKAVGSSSALLGYVRAASLGDKVKLTIVRGGQTMDVNVTLDQEETQVKGSNRSESQKQDSGQGDSGSGSDGSGSDDGDGGGLFDPFGLW
ncbi:trypsin-like peptidase domain-containing protein [Bifidobacterium sp. ESL0790]|uniref:S1C family serine protease n=1 Tax=Bifidobacterium sp. ESL0790 TaxID=2983233 RepID=UPI0023F6B70B|nr:trypsin-like peptidase domain-containing protein [Bifidobacterium sp. ESL0790]WEV72401.1 trypsin-like peptidase domain-containing protein [Bifidobacterium sp. ESL0790]